MYLILFRCATRIKVTEPLFLHLIQASVIKIVQKAIMKMTKLRILWIIIMNYHLMTGMP